ncbi:MAG: hypothetical protein PVJ39_01985, partial [Gammaproteobacteria bacterium]
NRSAYLAKLQALCYVKSLNELPSEYREYVFNLVAKGKSIPESQDDLGRKIVEDIKAGKQLGVNMINRYTNLTYDLNLCHDAAMKQAGL